MSGYIDREQAENAINLHRCDTSRIEEAILHIPSANVIPIPEGATNGDMLLNMFDTATVYGRDKEKDCITICIDNNFYQKFRCSWWDAPYKKGVEE